MTEHVDVLLVAGDRVQGLPEKLPVPLELNVTEPVGDVCVPAAVSVTVAVQVDAVFTATEAGTQFTLTSLDRLVTAKLKFPELPE